MIYCLMYFSLFVGVLCLSLFCYALLCDHSSFAIIMNEQELLSYRCIVTINVLWLSPCAMGWSAVCDCGISDHTHLLSDTGPHIRK